MERIKEINRGFRFIEATIQRLEKEKLAKSHLKITRREFTYIAIIGDNEGKTTSEFIAGTGVTKSTMSNQIKLLVEKGFIELEKDEKDSRRKRIKLRPKGKEAIKLHAEIRQEIKKEYSKILTDKEITTLINVGRKILLHIQGDK